MPSTFRVSDSGRGTTRAEDAQGTPTQSHIPPNILVYEDKVLRIGRAGALWGVPPHGLVNLCRAQPLNSSRSLPLSLSRCLSVCMSACLPLSVCLSLSVSLSRSLPLSLSSGSHWQGWGALGGAASVAGRHGLADPPFQVDLRTTTLQKCAVVPRWARI